MRGSTGIDLFGVIDSQLNWNTVPKGKHRVPRRPRTSFIDGKKSTNKKSTIEDIIDKELATGDMTVSDSEKLGVSILGHRFDGPMEGVPIKKRFHLGKSSYVSSHPVSDLSSQVFESPGLASQHSDAGDHTQIFGNDNSSEVVDFSGISILAAAACDSSFSGDVLNCDPSLSTKKEPDNSDGSNDNFCELCGSNSVAPMTAGVSSIKKPEAATVNVGVPKENSISHTSNQAKDDGSPRKVKASRDVRLHWDLNKAMDAWECPLENDEKIALDSGSGVIDKRLVKTNSCSSSVGLHDIGCMSEPTSEMVSCHVHEHATCRKGDQNAHDGANVVEPEMNRFNELEISYSSAESTEQLSPNVSGELPSCNLDSAAETEGSSSDEVSTRNASTSDMNAVTSQAPIKAPENSEAMVDNSKHSYPVGKDLSDKNLNGDNESADHIEVSSLCVSAGADNEFLDNDNGEALKDEDQPTEKREGAPSENISQACQSRENVESQPPSVSNACISEVSTKPTEPELENNFDTEAEEHHACEDTPAICDRVSLYANDQHEDFQSDLSNNRIGSVLVCVPSPGSMQRGVDRIVGHSNDDYDPEQLVGMEKIELEDGELRESMFDWEIDGNEDTEVEHVDYDTDSKDMYEDSSDHLASAALPHQDNPEEKFVGNLSNSVPFKETEKFGSPPSFGTVNNIANEGKGVIDITIKGASRRRDGKMSPAGIKIGVTVDPDINVDDGKERLPRVYDSGNRSTNPVSCSKFSGWDRTFDGSDALREITADVDARRGCSNGPSSISPGRTQRAIIKSSVMKDVSLRTDRTHTSKFSQRKVGSDIYDSRSHNRKDLNQNTERDGSRAAPFSRAGSSIQMRERNKCGSWSESQSPSGSFQHEAPGYYSSNSFAKHGFKNAAEAAAARVAENGLVVAPDGTVVEPDHLVESTIRAPRKTSSNSSIAGRNSLSGRFSAVQRDGPLASGRHSELRPLREISPSRHIPAGKTRGERYGPKVFSNGHRGARYDGPNPRDEYDASLSSGQPLYQRDRSYSPHRSSFRIYACQAKSRSRSRTRSPPGWASPRKRGDGRRSGSPFRRWSRSPPNFRSEIRSDELRSPGRKPSFLDRVGGDFVSITKWMCDRKDARDSFRQHEYRRTSGRSPPGRLPSHIHGRPEAEEYRQPIHHGRFRDFPGVGKRARFDRDENRGRAPRQNDGGDRIKRLQYDADGFSLGSSCFQNEMEIPSGGRSRGFNRGTDNDIQRSPRRTNSDRCHFRYASGAGAAAKYSGYRGDEAVSVPASGKRS